MAVTETLRGRLDDLWLEVRNARRSLWYSRSTAIVAVLSLGLGLALTASTLAVVNAYLIRSLPYPAADRLYHVVYARPGQPEPRGMTALDWTALGDVVDVADASAGGRFYIKDGEYTQEAVGLLVAPGSVDVLGVRVVRGRSLGVQDFKERSESVALIGDSLWRDRFGADPDIVGRVFRASRADQASPPETLRIVGVLEPGLRDVRGYARGVVEIVAPLRTPMRTYLVRLRAGVPAAAAERRISDAARRVASSLPADWAGVRLESVHERYVAGIRPMLIAVAVASGLVLLIVCANVAVLMLLRALRRDKELAVRVSLGATDTQLLRMAAVESGLVCAIAATVGLVLTRSALSVLAPLIEQHLGRPAPGGTSAIGLDPAVVLASSGIAVLIAVSLSSVPTIARSRRRLADALRGDGRYGTDRPTARRMRSALIALELAVSLALVAGCGLMIRSALNLVRTDLGFRAERIVRSRVALPGRAYPDSTALLAFFERLGAGLATQANAPFAFTSFPPFVETPTQAVEAEDADTSGLTAGVLAVSDGYFAALAVGLKEGRGFTSADRLGSEPVAIVSDTLARRLWPAGTAIGRHIRTAERPAGGSPLTVWRTVVGVAADVRQTYADADVKDIYLPFFQAPVQYATLYIRTDRPAAFWLQTLRETIARIDPEVLIGGTTPLEREGDRLLAGTRFLTSVLTGFAAFAVLLAVLGIYGVTAYAVQQREREIAIRVALGATANRVIALFVKRAGGVLAGGIAVGLLGAVAVAQTLATQLHGVGPYDVSTLMATLALMTLASLIATWWPVRRAARRAPFAALKET